MNRKPIIILVIILLVIYSFLFLLSSDGWGYAGYRGFHRGPSFFYFGGPRYYGTSSLRRGSLGGSNRLGGGPGYGK